MHEIRLEKVAGEADTSTWPGQMYIWVENLQSTWQNCRLGSRVISGYHGCTPWVEHCLIIQQSTSIGDGLLGLPHDSGKLSQVLKMPRFLIRTIGYQKDWLVLGRLTIIPLD